MNKPTLKPYTHARSVGRMPSRSENPPHDQNLSISMSLPTLRKMLTKLKEMEEMKKAQHLTKAIRNLGNGLKFKFIALNKVDDKLKVNRFKIPNNA
ncbi:MAG: hypothetical protein GXO79_15585 [Chlorobi bacterium]|nr:hypothetical protein [Chlorobiota bacterium]